MQRELEPDQRLIADPKKKYTSPIRAGTDQATGATKARRKTSNLCCDVPAEMLMATLMHGRKKQNISMHSKVGLFIAPPPRARIRTVVRVRAFFGLSAFILPKS